MDILVIAGEFPKLSQTFILNQITGLIDAGHRVTVLAKKSDGNARVHEAVAQYRLLDHTVYYHAREPEQKWKKTALYLIHLARFTARTSLRPGRPDIHFSDIARQPNLMYMVRALKKADTRKFDIIHAHFGPNGLLAQHLIDSGVLEGKLFVTFHGYDMLRFVRQKGENVYSKLFRSDAVLLPISEFWKKRCINLGAPPANIRVHHMGIDTEKFDFCPLFPHENETIKMLTVARFVEKKGIAYSIAAVDRLIREGISVEYWIVGGGPLEGRLKQEIKERGLGSAVRLLGWKTQEELVEIMKQAHIVLLPSVTARDGDMEGIPVLLMEAMAMGKIAVSTYHSGIPELIRDKENGFLTEERDAGKLALVLREALEKRASWPMIARRARETVEESFHIEKLNRRLMDMFEGSLKP